MDDGSFDKITIVIPTFNRCSYLFRLLDYYRLYAPGIRIVIGDSSLDKNKEINRRTILSLSDSNILHFNYPSDIIGLLKVQDLLNQVNTKYCVFCGDDDFIIPNGINQSVNFLEDNPDFTVAPGHYISFETEVGKGRFCWKPCYAYESNISPDAASRLLSHFANYTATTSYAVNRTDFLNMIFKEAIKFTSDDRFGELLPSMLALIYGKMKHLNVLYAVREFWSGADSRASKNMPDFVREGTFDEKYAKFRECLATHLSRQSQLNIEEAEKTVDTAMHLYYAVNFTLKKKEIKSLSLYKRLFLPGKIVMDNFARSVEDPSSKYYDDFNKIRNHVLHHSRHQSSVGMAT